MKRRLPIHIGGMVVVKGTDEPWMQVEELDRLNGKAFCTWSQGASSGWFELKHLKSVDVYSDEYDDDDPVGV